MSRIFVPLVMRGSNNEIKFLPVMAIKIKIFNLPGGEQLAPPVLLLVSIEEFFVDPKNGTLETKKPPAMRVVEDALAYSKKPPVLQ